MGKSHVHMQPRWRGTKSSTLSLGTSDVKAHPGIRKGVKRARERGILGEKGEAGGGYEGGGDVLT